MTPVRIPTPLRAVYGVFGAAALALIAFTVVFFTRWLASLTPVEAFLAAYPGAAPMPEGQGIGIPPWLSWAHFLNAFFLLLIIRSGIRIRGEKTPSGLWTSRRVKKRRMSLTIWFHIAVDVLWLLNGIAFIVLLFATGHWVRIVPTSWDVFPNALSALIQYVSLDWPTHSGWTGYNGLQQLSYFAIVFVASPLAILTGARLSAFWPRETDPPSRVARLNRMFPVDLAKAVHFPTMLFFVGFVIAHVGLVFATGALRNLNAMYGGQDAVNWTGFWIFTFSLIAMAGGWIAARDSVIAPIAQRFGDVRMRPRR
ncbi:cytochrome b/b6 domain-containing protein [Microbacterium sp.]|uniref:cytochrome b/b6 domain-containing protein n=1 Tax=Microbacterium sp. TaxID=51671 RepID=UPI002811D512|nr:cytochrome b/b6 domain-containing protein [Microbacterium sp.]